MVKPQLRDSGTVKPRSRSSKTRSGTAAAAKSRTGHPASVRAADRPAAPRGPDPAMGAKRSAGLKGWRCPRANETPSRGRHACGRLTKSRPGTRRTNTGALPRAAPCPAAAKQVPGGVFAAARGTRERMPFWRGFRGLPGRQERRLQPPPGGAASRQAADIADVSRRALSLRRYSCRGGFCDAQLLFIPLW